ncbi:protein FATTY ACID EXPORT 1, chloroplastic [Cannabis sativa]|uniref:protein FATTY ACID EXPORT 1, chloroplastic n=1 Tax=Cannabis sativa TaxID=3483 RepID=UPI0029CA563C|nr:protein FATTY ACID EXPORT 1, chloroplastic [Cannabis sativa]XP_060967501.1 protein FATTY ACID EXPORT 1, chloroplastic [Cannabis sativa]
MAAATATTSQLSCFSAINRQLYSHSRSFLRPQSWILTSVERSCGSISKNSLSYVSNERKPHVERAEKSSYTDVEEDQEVENLKTTEPTKAAKIHDFCFGIPFGGIVLSGGVLGFIFSRNLATLTTGLLYGGALLALSTFSLMIWREGKSSLPYILGQGALAAALLWKNFQTFSLTKKVFPTGVYAFISAAMLCFYSYVLLSGGNPPPKKLKSSATPSAAL